VPRQLRIFFKTLFLISSVLKNGHNTHHTKRKSRRGPELGKLPKILGFPFNISATTSNLVCSLGLPRAIIKSHPEEKVGVAFG